MTVMRKYEAWQLGSIARMQIRDYLQENQAQKLTPVKFMSLLQDFRKIYKAHYLENDHQKIDRALRDEGVRLIRSRIDTALSGTDSAQIKLSAIPEIRLEIKVLDKDNWMYRMIFSAGILIEGWQHAGAYEPSLVIARHAYDQLVTILEQDQPIRCRIPFCKKHVSSAEES